MIPIWTISKTEDSTTISKLNKISFKAKAIPIRTIPIPVSFNSDISIILFSIDLIVLVKKEKRIVGVVQALSFIQTQKL